MGCGELYSPKKEPTLILFFMHEKALQPSKYMIQNYSNSQKRKEMKREK